MWDDSEITEPPAFTGASVARSTAKLFLLPPLGFVGTERPLCFDAGARTIIGRGEGARIRIPHATISRAHAEIRRGPNGYTLRDLGSRAGTYLNGRRLHKEVLLENSSVFTVGSFGVLFSVLHIADLDEIDRDWRAPFAPIPTNSPSLAAMHGTLQRKAKAGLEVLLVGETGVGKEVYARAYHTASGRKGPFVAINCAAIPRELIESELFGARKGAHSQATTDKRGLVESAEGGTIFLDEIAEIDVSLQAKLLRFIQFKEYLPLGASSPRRADIGVIAATNKPGNLRTDLRFRLGATPVTIPPLRQRREDIPLLTGHFLEQKGLRLRFSSAVLNAFLAHHWPGNIRELEHSILHIGTELDDDVVGIEHLPFYVPTEGTAVDGDHAASVHHVAGHAHSAPPSRTKRKSPAMRVPTETLKELLVRHAGCVATVARSLDRKHSVVWRWIREDGICLKEYRKGKGVGGP